MTARVESLAPKETPPLRAKFVRAVTVLSFCLALVPSLLAQDTFTRPRTISVTGTAEIKVAPDEVILMLGVDSRDKDLSVAKTDNDQRVKKLLNLAHAAGVDPKNIQTSALTMGPEYSDERIPKLLGYQVSQVVTITLTDLSKYEDLMTNSLKAGVNRVDGINFVVAEPSKYKEDARLEAIRAAHEKASAMAAQLGQTLGKPWEITEEPNDDYSPRMNANFLAGVRDATMPQEESTVAGGQVMIRASIRVSFQLE
jgi:uncharacterized protein YggE